MFKRILQILLIAACAAALPVSAGLDFFVAENGALNILRNAKPVIIGEDLWLRNATLDKVVQPLSARVVRNNERGGKVVCVWGSGESSATRTVERADDGRLKVTWQMNFPAGITDGDHLELAYLMPKHVFNYPEGGPIDLFGGSREMQLDVGDALLTLEFPDGGKTWKFQDMRAFPLYGNYRLFFVHPYQSDRVNTVETTILIGEKDKEEQ